MSCYMVSDSQIDALITAAIKFDTHNQLPAPQWWTLAERYPSAGFDRSWTRPDFGAMVKANADEIGRALLLANLDSVRARYTRPDQQAAHAAEEVNALAYRYTPNTVEPVSVLKQVHNFCYQACETDAWESSWAFKFCAALEAVTIRNLPGYDAAPWGI